jgi:hypothetical protein
VAKFARFRFVEELDETDDGIDNFEPFGQGGCTMHVRSAALIAGMLLGIGSGASMAQTGTQTMGIDECRSQAIGKGLTGDARNKAINDCMGRPVVQGAPTAAGSRFTTCHSDARARSLSGDAFNAALDQCMAQSGAAAESGGKATYPDCRSRGVSRGLAGDSLGEFIDSCLND